MIEPGILAIALLVAVPAHQLVGAILARRHYRRVARIMTEIDGAPETTQADRDAVYRQVRETTIVWPVWIIALTAPLWFVPLLISSAADVVRYWGASDEEVLEAAREDYRRLEHALGGITDEHSDEFRMRRRELADEAMGAALLAAPLASLVIAVFLAPTVAILFLAGMADAIRGRLELLLRGALGRLGSLTAPARSA